MLRSFPSATNNKNPSPNSVTNSRNPFLSNTVIKPDKQNSYFSNIAISGGNPFLSNSVTNNQKPLSPSSGTSGNPFLSSVNKPVSPSFSNSGDLYINNPFLHPTDTRFNADGPSKPASPRLPPRPLTTLEPSPTTTPRPPPITPRPPPTTPRPPPTTPRPPPTTPRPPPTTPRPPPTTPRPPPTTPRPSPTTSRLSPSTPRLSQPPPNIPVSTPQVQPSVTSISLEELIPIKITGPVKTKSELKCDEYAGEISGVTEIQSLTGSSSGVFRVNNACQDSNHLVIGGVDAQPGEFPHMAALGRLFGQTFSYMCGGTLISHTWVLSAAHCTYGPNGDPTNVRIGFYELTNQAGIMIAISDMIRHPEYLPPELYADIALILLESPVTFSLAIRPACLYQRYDFVPKNAWVSGWGATEFAGDASNRLQKAQLTLISNVKCSEKHNTSIEVPHGISTNMICAGDVRGNRSSDTCEGDSGGPLQIIHPQNDCLFQVIGITSFGQACGIGDTPGVYTKVSPYLSWIESYVWPEGQ
ncbi:serine protease snake-like [Pogonomyrmex barbatus]|uniref:chymotrypsin n=1 Tax=Pogonomyrmex barbatus TaxID=144034 RepID=A0A6I9VW93_9HYME|nr:serine protease snake-like [Pogonomyrmex barbatus]